ncbi:cytochrome P450 [Methylobacterium platani]|uniref:Cytochrome n=2 Tax=Methylobacterium platani TaxID=427683 RepID=A0A179SBP0_9HYPH|nr:cytochrome P450 [Methylobacterium platani]KMO13616.1 cytochrome P450 [Methylobacterium platani JCM 14648]OAS25218.1 cytochrome [Methylobacterium platani]
MATPTHAAAPPTDLVVVPRAVLEADPHAVLARHRAVVPCIRTDDGVVMLLRAGDVQALVADPRTRQVETEFALLRGITAGPLFEFFRQTVLLSNGEVHRRRRAPIARAFAFQVVAALRPRIRALAEGLVAEHRPSGRMHLLADYAALLPAQAIALILGLPERDVPDFTAWVYAMSRALTSAWGPADFPESDAAARRLIAYVEDLVAQRRRSPRDDLISALLPAIDEDDPEAAAETRMQIVSLILAGSDTTRAALAIQAGLLLADRAQWEAVCRDEALIPGAVAEALRFEPAVGSFPRFALAEIPLEGAVLRAGTLMSFSTLSAMRDPAVYADPDVFDIRRSDHPRWHPVFGGGVHRCLGEALARIELEEGLRALTRGLPDLRADRPLVVRGSAAIRRVDELPVSWPTG